MDIEKLLRNLSDQITCSICFEVYDDPRRLSCGHRFCLKCLSGINRRRQDQIRCPQCSENTQVEGGSLDSMPVDFNANSLKDVFFIKECEARPVKCHVCREFTPSGYYCFQCCEFFCPSCLKPHSVIRSTMRHRALALSEFTDSDIEQVLRRPVFCGVETHSDKPVEYFCEACTIPVCQKCTTVGHTGHKFVVIEDKAEKIRNEMRGKMDSVHTKLEEVLMLEKKLREDKMLIEEQRLQVEEDLNGTLNKIRKLFEKLFLENNQKSAKFQEEVDKQLQSLLEVKEQIKTFSRNVECTLSAVHPGNLCLEMLQRQEQTALSIYDKTWKEFHRNIISYRPSMELKEVIKAETVGQVLESPTAPSKCSIEGRALQELVKGITTSIIVCTRDRQGQLVYCADDNIEVDVESREVTVKEVLEMTDRKTGHYEFKFTPSALTEYQISVTVNSDVANQSVFNVRATEREFRVVKVIGKKGKLPGQFDGPFGLSVDKEGNIAVADAKNNRIQVFDSNGELTTQPFGRGVLKWPLGITHVPNSDNLLVSDNENSTIEMFKASTGEHVKTICRKGSANGQVKNPYGLSIDGDGNIIVCDWGNDRIQVISQEGEFIRELVSKEDGMSAGNCVYYGGLYYVIAQIRTSVKVLNKNGDHVQEFRDKDGNVHILDNPTGLAVDKNGVVVVCEAWTHRLHVYRDGVLVNTFGSHGTKPGLFDHPFDVKMLPNGFIVVSDRENNRVQILK